MQKTSLSFLLLVLVLFFAFKTLPWKKILGQQGVENAIESRVTKLEDLPLLNEGGLQTTWQDELENQPAVLLSFWATWCAPCIEELPLLIEAEMNLKMMGIKLLPINFDSGIAEESGRAKVSEWLEEHDIKLATYYDSQDRFLEELGVHGLPYNALIAQDGKILWAKHGEVDIEAVVKRWSEIREGAQ